MFFYVFNFSDTFCFLSWTAKAINIEKKQIDQKIRLLHFKNNSILFYILFYILKMNDKNVYILNKAIKTDIKMGNYFNKFR